MQAIRVRPPAHLALRIPHVVRDLPRPHRPVEPTGRIDEILAKAALVVALLLAPLPVGPELPVGVVQAAVVMR